MELPLLKPEEIRVLGSLIEKSKTTPDYYPMSLNALTAACNQKTSRNPVTDFDEESVQGAINSLKGRSLVATAVGGGSRTLKYKHNFHTIFPEITDAGLAIMCLLFLRGPLTPGEINAGSGRLYEFSSIESVVSALEELMKGDYPLVALLPRRPGQKEARYAHLFAGVPVHYEEPPEATQESRNNLTSRIDALEREVQELRALIDKIPKDLLT